MLWANNLREAIIRLRSNVSQKLLIPHRTQEKVEDDESSGRGLEKLKKLDFHSDIS